MSEDTDWIDEYVRRGAAARGELKRAILAEHAHDDAVHGNGIGCKICHDHGDGIIGAGWCATVRQLGTEFDQHPEYQAGWAP